ncbi:XAC2610-related protein [Flavobacterium columnare]|nr:hypothetical protein [Flavobacterium columnare]
MMKQIIKILLFSFLITACNGQVTNSKKLKTYKDNTQNQNTNKEQVPVDFFDKKYFNGYMISFGDSDISEHPYRYYYNYRNKEVQWFAISYVPKDISLRNYWLNYLQDPNTNEIGKSSEIEKIVTKKLNLYNIFAVYIPKIYLDVSNGESEEAMFFKKNTEIYFYQYNLSEKKWNFLKKLKTNNPLIGKYDFFYKQFSQLFSSDTVSKSRNNEIENFSTSKKFKFKFQVSTINNDEDNEKQKINITIKNIETNKNQEIDFVPEMLYTKKNNLNSSIHSYFNPKQELIKTSEGIEQYHDFILLDFNFDGLEDFAIINYEGSNGGPQYAYYKQNSKGQFELDLQLTDDIRLFPIEINNKGRNLKFGHPSGCCKINTFVIKIQSNGKWKETYSKLDDIK